MAPGYSLQHLQRLLNWGVCIAASQHKYDHVSVHRASTVSDSVSSLCAIYKQYSPPQGMFLDPPIEFGTRYDYCSRHEN